MIAWIKHRGGWVVEAKTGSAAVVQTLLGRILVLGTNLMCSVLTARFLGPAGRGEQSAMAMWPQFIAFVSTFGLQQALIYLARKDPDDRGALISATLVWSVVLGTVASVIGILFLPFWLGQKYDASTIRFAQLLMLMSPAVMLGVTINAIFETNLFFARSNLLRYGIPVLTLASLVGLALAHRFTPKYSALAYILPSLVVLVAMFPSVWKTFSWTLARFGTSTRRLFGYGIRIYGITVLSTFGQQIDQVLVVSLLAPASLGVYVVALNVSRVLNVFQTSISIVLLPKIAGAEAGHVYGIVGSVARLSLLFSASGGILLAIAMPLLLPKIFGAAFLMGVVVAQILIVESVLASTIGVILQAFIATNRPAVATVMQAIGLALTVPLMLVLIPRFGLIGAALSLLGSTMIRLLVALLSFPTILHAPMPSLILKKSDISFLRLAIARRSSPS